MKVKMIQRVGDRDKICWSIKDIAFTITANAQSKVQKVLEVYEDQEPSERED